MRGNIVVRDDINQLLEWGPIHAEMCAELSGARYKSLKSPEGMPVCMAITRTCEAAGWCNATLTGNRRFRLTPRPPIPQKAIVKSMNTACGALLRTLRKRKWRVDDTSFVPLIDPEFGGVIALQVGTVVQWTVVVHQVLQYHLRRAFYTIDRESGMMFPGGHKQHLRQYEETVLSRIMPLAGV